MSKLHLLLVVSFTKDLLRAQLLPLIRYLAMDLPIFLLATSRSPALEAPSLVEQFELAIRTPKPIPFLLFMTQDLFMRGQRTIVMLFSKQTLGPQQTHKFLVMEQLNLVARSQHRRTSR